MRPEYKDLAFAQDTGWYDFLLKHVALGANAASKGAALNALNNLQTAGPGGATAGLPAPVGYFAPAIEAEAWVTDRVPPGMVYANFHFPEASANELTLAALDPVAKIPEYKVCAVKVERVNGKS